MVEGTGARADEAHRLAVARAGRIGRRVATATYLVGLAYMVVVGFGTVMTSVFAHASPADLALVAGTSCEAGLSDLEQTLVTGAAEHVASRGTSSLEWLGPWDRRFRALNARCAGPDYRTLERLRQHFDITLQRFDREEARWSRQLHDRASSARAADHRAHP